LYIQRWPSVGSWENAGSTEATATSDGPTDAGAVEAATDAGASDAFEPEQAAMNAAMPASAPPAMNPRRFTRVCDIRRRMCSRSWSATLLLLCRPDDGSPRRLADPPTGGPAGRAFPRAAGLS
jgi:hypothetical protein